MYPKHIRSCFSPFFPTPSAEDLEDMDVPTPERIMTAVEKLRAEDAATEQYLDVLLRRGAQEQDKHENASDYLLVVVAIAAEYQGCDHALDLIENGNTGLQEAQQSFPTEQGIDFAPYATWFIHRAIQRGLVNDSTPPRPRFPEETIRAKAQLVEDHLYLAEKIASSFAHWGLSEDDLIAAAMEGLLTAVEKYDPDKGRSFADVASVIIRNAITEALFRHRKLMETIETQT